MQIIGITGGTGFVGHHLTNLLHRKGCTVIIFTRDMHKVSRIKNVKYSFWSPHENKFDLRYLGELNGVINLAGESLDQRWTKRVRKEIVSSRVAGSEFLIEKIRMHAPQCKVLVAASAVGYYGPDRPGMSPFHEDAPPANDFLGNTCRLWENANHAADELMRTVILRFGITIGKEDGVFKKFSRPQDFGLVPILGTGRQVVSWIHVDDLCHMILYALENEDIKGTFNASSPYPASYKEIMLAIAKQKGGIKIPIHVPELAIKLLLGKMGKEALKSITMSAEKIQQAGYRFKYPTIESAVKEIIETRS